MGSLLQASIAEANTTGTNRPVAWDGQTGKGPVLQNQLRAIAEQRVRAPGQATWRTGQGLRKLSFILQLWNCLQCRPSPAGAPYVLPHVAASSSPPAAGEVTLRVPQQGQVDQQGARPLPPVVVGPRPPGAPPRLLPSCSPVHAALRQPNRLQARAACLLGRRLSACPDMQRACAHRAQC